MPRRSENSHALNVRLYPHHAILRRETSLRPADSAELDAACQRIAGGDQWYSRTTTDPDLYGFRIIGFATEAQAREMQAWLDATDFANRPQLERRPHPKQLSVGRYGVD